MGGNLIKILVGILDIYLLILFYLNYIFKVVFNKYLGYCLGLVLEL